MGAMTWNGPDGAWATVWRLLTRDYNNSDVMVDGNASTTSNHVGRVSFSTVIRHMSIVPSIPPSPLVLLRQRQSILYPTHLSLQLTSCPFFSNFVTKLSQL